MALRIQPAQPEDASALAVLAEQFVYSRKGGAMNIIVLGGAGDMGSQAVETLAHCPDVRRITIADKNVAGAEALARHLAGVGPEIAVRPLEM